MKELWGLFITFFKIGGVTFGGGLAMLPMLKYELVQKRQWVTEEEMLDYYAIGQCTPGVIAVNIATFIGYRRKGILGGIVATLGMITPSLIIITLIAMFLTNFMDNVWVGHALMGIRAVVCALMATTAITLARKSLVDALCWVIFAAAFLGATFTNIPTILLVVVAGAVGAAVQAMRRKKA